MNDRFLAEYALRDINKPIGISEYRLAESLPEKLKGSLPTIEELESELGSAARSPMSLEKLNVEFRLKRLDQTETSETLNGRCQTPPPHRGPKVPGVACLRRPDR
ncbi:MAG TPA: hypothetical protein VG297_02455 [Bryobacteraceae bacterium]|jgi:hypothetical protein|nr:hypothetical protein [Bryobacteraceae bacterium]